MDLTDPVHQERFSKLLALAAEQDLPYPLVAINGQLRVAGSAHYYRVLPYVEEVLQAEEAIPEA